MDDADFRLEPGDEVVLGDSPEHPLPVGLLTKQIREILEDSFGTVWIAGEISNLRTPGSGHVYFVLKDEDSVLNCVLFRGDAIRVRFPLQDGISVLVRGEVTVYEPRGQVQLQVREVRPQGLGSLSERFEALKRQLAAEGVFDEDRKQSIPVFPEVIGVVTSLQAAAWEDFQKVVRRRAPGVRLQVRGVRVQGDGAAAEVAAAIRAYNAAGEADVLVVTRGGGSLEDLWAFNEKEVAYAIRDSEIPVISAVGHEIDFTLADFAADLRASTPSVAAELVVRDWAEWRDAVAGLRRRLDRDMRGVLETQRHRLQRLAESHVFREPRRVVEMLQQRLDDVREDLVVGLRRVVRERRLAWDHLAGRWRGVDPRAGLVWKRERLALLTARLRALSPQATLDRGYAVVTDASGRLVREAGPELVGREASVQLARGRLDVLVKAARNPDDQPESGSAPSHETTDT